MLAVRPFAIADTQAVIALWEECGLTRPWNSPQRDILRKLTTQADLFLVGEWDGELVAASMASYDGHRGWIYYFAVALRLQRQGVGREFYQHIEDRLLALGCPKINLQVRSDNHAVQAFYRSLGFGVDAALSMGKRLIADD